MRGDHTSVVIVQSDSWFSSHQRQHLNYEDPLAKDKFGVAGPSGLDADQEEASEDDSSLAGSPSPTRKSKRFCAVCDTEDAEQWYKCPMGLGEPTLSKKEKTLCPSCANQWRHCKPFKSILDGMPAK